MSSRTSTAPVVIAASATLNAQKCEAPQYTSTKSTTCPATARSIRLPNAPAQNERESESRQPLVEPQLRAVGGDRDEGDRRDADHHRRLVRKLGGVEDPEGRPGVLHVRQIQKPGNDVDAVVQRHRLPDDQLRHLVEEKDRGNRDELHRPGVSLHFRRRRRFKAIGAGPQCDVLFLVDHAAIPPSARAATHRAQSPCVSEADEISGTMRQHRAHLAPSARATVDLERVSLPSCGGQLHLRRDEQHGQRLAVPLEQREGFTARPERHSRRERGADRLRLTRRFERPIHLVAHGDQSLPVGDQRGIRKRVERFARREFRKMHRLLARAGKVPPQLFAGHRKHGRQQPGEPVCNHVHRCLG